MKGEWTLRVLEKIMEGAVGISDVFAAMLQEGYGASSSRLLAVASERNTKRMASLATARDRLAYQKLIAKLVGEGLVSSSGRSHERSILITKKGREKVTELRKRKSTSLPKKVLVAKPSQRFTIVAFDVPEGERRKRNWIRKQLELFGFRMIQKSVWIGKYAIPKEFMMALGEMRIADTVVIFEITKSGTLRVV